LPSAAFRLLGCASTSEEQFSYARRVAARTAVPGSDIFASRPPRGERVRLGYLSANFHAHPVAHLIAGLIEHHDRRRFEVMGYGFDEDDGSALRGRLVGAFDRFVDIADTQDQDAARLIHTDDIDIVVDLHGWTPDCRAKILAYRPAAIQVNYLGYPGTSGAEFIDYIIVDRFVVPAEQQPFFSERAVYLPDCYQCNDDKRETAARTPSRRECGLPERGLVFCCFNNSWKLTPLFFDIWMRLLRAVPESVLWLYEANPLVKANLAREAEARGIAPERLVFASRLPQAEHLARHRLADLFLDTLPYNAHTTASDALWAGLPVLTCAGSTFAGRVAGSLLRAVGLDELVTASLEEYEALALQLARDAELLTGLRARLAQNRRSYPLFDTGRYTRHLEAAYWRMSEIRMAGQPPIAFFVPRSGDIS
jgi:protein O-GlcNAc transferase